MKNLAYTLASILLLALGVLQLYVTTLGIGVYTGWHWTINIFLALCLATWPTIGTIAAIFFAIVALHWALPLVVLCFVAPFVAVYLLTGDFGGFGYGPTKPSRS